jgi:hypothetical protein
MCFFLLLSGYSKILQNVFVFRISENYYSQSFFSSSTKARNKAKRKTTRINMEYGQDVETSGIP